MIPPTAFGACYSAFSCGFFDQLVVDILLRVPGYFLVKLFTPAGAPDPDPDSFLVALVGLLFWLAVCVVGWFVLSQLRFSPRSWS